MKHKLLGWLSVGTLVLTILWLLFLIFGVATGGSMQTFDETFAYVAKLTPLYYLTYINATLVTLSASLLFAVLYGSYKKLAPELAMMGLVFVPVYAVLNLFVYLSQITIVPGLVDLYQRPEYRLTAYVLLQQLLHIWPGSGAAFFNGLAYAILGIPSIFFGWILLSQNKLHRLAGALLALNGIACIFGVIGVILKSGILSSGTIIGGVLFLLALIPLSLSLRETP